MKKIFLPLVAALALVCQTAAAQFVRMERWPSVPPQYETAFVDLVGGNYANVMRASTGQYFGQVDSKGELYGFGAYFTDGEGQVFGLFCKSQFMIGIKLGVTDVKVGSDDHYIVYDPKTGAALYIMKDGKRYSIDAARRQSWKFLRLKYSNGAEYVGETVDGQRDGYGVYYYADGDYYFGRYSDGAPVGYGATFKTDNRLIIQNWNEADNEADGTATR